MPRSQRPPSGFTLIELCLVLAVMGILAALAVRPFNGIRDRAKAAEAISTARAVEVAAEVHWAAEQEWPPTSPPGRMPESLEDYLPYNFTPERNGYLVGWNGPETESGVGVVLLATDPGVGEAFSELLRGPDWMAMSEDRTEWTRDRTPASQSAGGTWVLIWDDDAGEEGDASQTAQR